MTLKFRAAFLLMAALLLLPLAAFAEEATKDAKEKEAKRPKPPFSEKIFAEVTDLEWIVAEKCSSDVQCTIIPAFHDCCGGIAVAREHMTKIMINRDELWKKLTPSGRQTQCGALACSAPNLKAVCDAGRCVAVPKTSP